MIQRRNIVERLAETERLHAALEWALGFQVPEDKTSATWCPVHQQDAGTRKDPAAIVKPKHGRVDCASCGVELGLLDLAVATGRAPNKALAARQLEKYFLGAGDATTSRPPPSSSPATRVDELERRLDQAMEALQHHDEAARAFGFAPESLKRAGGGVVLDQAGAATSILLPVLDPGGELIGLKERYMPGHTPKCRNHGTGGMLNWHRLEELGEQDLVVLVEGETDLSALQEAFDALDAGVVVLSPSSGSQQDLSAFAARLQGHRVALCYDEDEAGRKGAEKVAAALLEHVGELRRVRLPFTHPELGKGLKDVRDWLDAGGTGARFLDLVEAAPAEARKRIEWGLLDELLLEPLEPRQWVLEGWLHEARTMILFGATYSGKSLLAYQMVGAIARGEGGVVGHSVRGRPRRVGLVMGENDKTELKEVLEVQAAVGGGFPRGVYLDALLAHKPRLLGTDEGRAYLRRAVRDQGLEVVVLDNLMSLTGDDLQKSEVAIGAMAGLKMISKETGVAWVIVAHTRKPGQKGDDASPAGKLYGAHEWLSYADAGVYLAFERDPESGRREVHTVKVRGSKPDRTVIAEINEETLTFEFVAEKGAKLRQLPRSRTLAALRHIEDLRMGTIHELQERLGVSRAAVYRIVGSADWQAWTEQCVIEVVSSSPRGGATAWRFVGPFPEEEA